MCVYVCVSVFVCVCVCVCVVWCPCVCVVSVDEIFSGRVVGRQLDLLWSDRGTSQAAARTSHSHSFLKCIRQEIWGKAG